MVILGRCLGAKAQVQGGAISGFDIWPGGLPALPHFGSQARRVCVELHTLSIQINPSIRKSVENYTDNDGTEGSEPNKKTRGLEGSSIWGGVTSVRVG